MLLFYDFEVFKHNWLVVIVDAMAEKEYNFIDDPEGLSEFYEKHKNYVWVGYNSRAYDTWILRAILAGHDPYKMSQWIVEMDKKGWEYDKSLSKIQHLDYDARPSQVSPGLKTYEAMMGHDIRETSVPFDIDRALTEEEIQQTLYYCRHDVNETMMVFCKLKEEFDAHMGLIREFDLELSNISKTKAQMTAIILNCQRNLRNDEWDFVPEDCVRISKYTNCLQWFADPKNRDVKNSKYDVELGACPSTLGWGGIHGAKKNYFRKGMFVAADVASYYPSLMIQWDMLSRNSRTPEKFKEIYEKRLELKRAGEKSLQTVLKRVINSAYGVSGDKFNAMYDPRQAHRVCMNGQLFFIDLIEKCEDFCEIVQVNTDGILVRVENEEDKQRFISVCEEWQKRTRMTLEFDDFVEIIQKDVNNYIMIPEGPLYDEKGRARFKTKGAFVKKLTEMDRDLYIVNKALVKYFTEGVPPEKTIQDCNELVLFQKIFKVSSLYKDAFQGCTFREETVIDDNGKKKKVKVWNGDGVPLTDKTYRIFATTERTGAVYKHKEGKNPETFALCPNNAQIVNENIEGASCPLWLDKQWYIDLAHERINQFEGKKKCSGKNAKI